MEVKSVKFEKSPIKETVFELRFPPILRIDTETPDTFQDLIRTQFPEYQVQNELQHEMLGNVFQNQFSSETKVSTKIAHVFSSVDRMNVVKLTRGNIFYSTKNYTGWDDFKEKSISIMEKFSNVYKTCQYSRIGLRYVNVIDRSELGVSITTQWDDLITSHYLGLLSDANQANKIETYDLVSGLRLELNLSINLRVTLLVNLESKDKCLGLDIDCFLPKESDEFKTVIESLHNHCEFYFFNTLKEKLYLAMDPIERE